MKRKRTFTTVLILITFLVALILTIGSFATNKAEITPQPNQDWEKPIYTFGDKYYLNWPDVDTDYLARSIVTYEGEVDMDKFESLFIQEFESQESLIDLKECEIETDKSDDRLDIMIDSNLRMYNSRIISNPTHTYSYHLKVNE